MATNEEVLELYNESLDFAEGEYIPIANRSHATEEVAYNKILRCHLEIMGDKISVVDLGCGIGIPLSLLPEKILGKLDYTGYDLNPRIIQVASERYQKYPNLKFEVRDIRKKDLVAPADLIIANESLVYVDEKELWNLIKYYYKMATQCLTISLVYRYPDKTLKLTKLDMKKFVGDIIARYPGAVVTRMPEDFLRISIYKKNIYDKFLESTCRIK